MSGLEREAFDSVFSIIASHLWHCRIVEEGESYEVVREACLAVFNEANKRNLIANQLEFERLQEALSGLLDRYVGLVNSGDAGFWNPEDEDVVKAARQALATTH